MTKDECLASLKQMAKGKSLGSDGLSAEFYLALWDSLVQDLVESLNYAFECGELTISERRGIITLIPKRNKNKLYWIIGDQSRFRILNIKLLLQQ